MADNGTGADTGAGNADKNQADGFRFLATGEVVKMVDTAARALITELSERVAALEEKPGIWAGKRAKYDIENEAGRIPEGTLLIFTDETEQAEQTEQSEESEGV